LHVARAADEGAHANTRVANSTSQGTRTVKREAGVCSNSTAPACAPSKLVLNNAPNVSEGVPAAWRRPAKTCGRLGWKQRNGAGDIGRPRVETAQISVGKNQK